MIIDFHTHVFPPEVRTHRSALLYRDATLSTLYSSPLARMASAEELVATMDGSGIDISVILGIGWDDLELGRICNDYIIESVRRFPLRLRGFCSVNPRWGQGAIAEVERCAQAGLVGIGELHPDTQGFNLGDHATMAPLVDIATSLGMPFLTHTSEPLGHQYAGKGNTTPDIVYRFVNNFPQAILICAHWGGGLPFYTLMPEVSSSLENVFFDTAASPLLYRPDVFPVVASLVGGNKILLGTDYPLIDQKRLIRQVTDAPLYDEDKEGILYANAARILGIS